MSWRGLSARMAKLEAKQRVKRIITPVIIGLYPEENAGDIVGLGNGIDEIIRLECENSLTAFACRASNALGHPRIMLAIYAD